jgi:hypothetical protein
VTKTADADSVARVHANESVRPRPEHAGYRYRAYGLSIQSDFALPELEPDPAADADADIVIRLRPVERQHSDPQQATIFHLGRDTQYLAWRSVGQFLIRGTSEIDIDPAPGVGEPLMRLPLLGTVMALLLHVRGQLVLHASAVSVGEGGVVFLGDKQAGKSTTAAAFVRAGHRLLADDVVAIDFSNSDGPRINPGFPQLKLSAGAEIGVNAVAMPPAVAGFDKRQHRLLEFQHTPARPTSFYLLEKGTRAAVTPMSPGDALAALIRFSYVARFGRAAFNPAGSVVHLRQCAALANIAKISVLEVPNDISRIGDIVHLLECDIA